MVQWLGLCAHNTGGMDSIPGQGSNVLHAAGVCVCQSSDRVRPFVTPWTAAHQAPLSMEFSGKNTGAIPFFRRSSLLPGIQPGSPALHADSLPSEPSGRFYNIKMSFCFMSFKICSMEDQLS